MSSTHRGAERVLYDAYQTPPELTDAIVRRMLSDGVVQKGVSSVLEPSAGLGAFVGSVRQHLVPKRLDAVDILVPDSLYRQGATLVLETDFLGYNRDGYELIIGNPPFSDAVEHIEHALSLLAPEGCLILLLRTAFVTTKRRKAFWAAHPCELEDRLVERPSFIGGGTDSSDYSVFVWRNDGPWRAPDQRAEWTCRRFSWR